MLKNYLKTAFRNFYRHLSYTVINVFGLTIGLATSIFIYLWIADEFSYEKHYKDSDRIYAVLSNIRYTDGRMETSQSTTGLLADALKTDFAEVHATARADWGGEYLLRTEQKSLLQRGVFADASIFDVLSLDIVEGATKAPLIDMNSIVLSESTARRLFGNDNPIGKIVRFDEQVDLTVKAVVRDQKQTQLQFDFLVSYEFELKKNPWMLEWDNTNDRTLVKLKPSVSEASMNAKLHGYIKSKCDYCTFDIWLQPFSETRLYDRYANGKPDGGRIQYVQIFAIIGVFILIIACINFMNLSTARSATRGREVGVRKVVGAHRRMLFVQFMGESILLAAFALILALASVQVALPIFNQITEKQVFLDFSNISFWLIVVAIVIGTGVIAGTYPSFFLSAFKPVDVLKGSVQSSMSGNTFRKSLVVFQLSR
jgi:putative ABC transport system permease protein